MKVKVNRSQHNLSRQSKQRLQFKFQFEKKKRQNEKQSLIVGILKPERPKIPSTESEESEQLVSVFEPEIEPYISGFWQPAKFLFSLNRNQEQRGGIQPIVT